MRGALLALAVMTASAAADPSVGVVITGDDSVSTHAYAQVETWLSKHSFAVAGRALTKDAILTVSNCITIADLACARDLVEKRAKAEAMVVVVAQGSGKKKNRDVQLSAYWIAKNKDVVSLQRMCNHCTTDVLAATIDGLMTDLSHLAPTMTGKIDVASTPPGLLVTCDNNAVGVTPIQADIPAGKHEIALTRNGTIVDHKSIEVTAGQTSDVVLVAPPEEKPKPVVIVRKSRAVPVTMLALGGAAIATGAYMYWKGGPTGDKLYYTDMRSSSYYVAGGGVALALVGAIWLARGGGTSTPTAALSHDGAMIGWAGRF